MKRMTLLADAVAAVSMWPQLAVLHRTRVRSLTPPTPAKPMLLSMAFALAACGGGSSSAPGPVVEQQAPSVARMPSSPTSSSCLSSTCIYVASSGPSGQKPKTDSYAGSATGNVAPLGQISGNKTLLGFPQGIAIDSNHKVYISSYYGTVTVYAAGANGNAKPIQTITGSNTGMNVPQKLAVDASSNVYVANSAIGDPSATQPGV